MTRRWWHDAACRTRPDLPWLSVAAASRAQVLAALAVCDRCPVFRACEADAVEHGDRVGVRAGRVWADKRPSLKLASTRAGCEVCAGPGPSGRSTYCSKACSYKGQRENRRRTYKLRNTR